MSELSHDMFIVDKRSLSDELMKREERYALFCVFFRYPKWDDL